MNSTPEQIEETYKQLRAALEPQRAGYTKAVFIYLRANVDRTLKLLTDAGNDAQKAAPFPDGNMSRERYFVAKHLYNEVHKWSISDKARHEREGVYAGRFNGPDFRLPLSNLIINEKLKSKANEITERDFQSYCTKLAGKIAKPVKSAAIAGHLWESSLLTVTIDEDFRVDTATNETQVWSTKTKDFSLLSVIAREIPTRRSQTHAEVLLARLAGFAAALLPGVEVDENRTADEAGIWRSCSN